MTMVLAPHRGAKTRAKAAHDADEPLARRASAWAGSEGISVSMLAAFRPAKLLCIPRWGTGTLEL